MRSDEAWAAGHRAALRLGPIYVLATVVSSLVLVAVAAYVPKPNIVMIAGFGVSAFYVALLVYTAYIASKAAKSATRRGP